jgi:steroid delta-isomerase-like uncharacterized protein
MASRSRFAAAPPSRRCSKGWAGKVEDFTATIEEIEIYGDTAYEMGSEEGTLLGGGGWRGRYVAIWKRQPDGTWLCYRDMFQPEHRSDATPAPKETMSDHVKAVLEAWPAAYGDAAKLAALHAPDATYRMAGKPEITGRDAIQADRQAFFDATSDEKLTIWRAWAKGNRVACEWVATGTQTKALGSIAASGKPFGFRGASVLTLDDGGHIVKEHTYRALGTYVAQASGSPDAPPIAVAPQGPMEMHWAKGDPSEDANVGAEFAWDNADKHDIKAIMSFVADDAALLDASSEKPTARADFMAVIAAIGKAFPDMKTRTDSFGVEDFTLSECEDVGTQTQDMVLPGFRLKATKKTFHLHNLEVAQWKNGKIAKFWMYSNDAEFALQAGLMKDSAI